MISPAELEKVEFSVSFRGYNGDQVDDYIDMVVKEFTDLTNEYEKYKNLCERQNEQIKIMRERILELENSDALSVKPTVSAEPETVVKTVVKTVVDTKATEEALEKAKALEKLASDFKVKALELYRAQLSELETLNFQYNADDYIVEAKEIEAVEEEPVSTEIKQTTATCDITEPIEAVVEEIKEEAETFEVSPIVTEDEPSEETIETVDVADEPESDTELADTPLTDDDSILSVEEIDALCNGDNDELNNILEQLSGLFGQKEEESPSEVEEKIKTETVKATATPKLVQQSFDSLFITSVDDGE